MIACLGTNRETIQVHQALLVASKYEEMRKAHNCKTWCVLIGMGWYLLCDIHEIVVNRKVLSEPCACARIANSWKKIYSYIGLYYYFQWSCTTIYWRSKWLRSWIYPIRKLAKAGTGSVSKFFLVGESFFQVIWKRLRSRGWRRSFIGLRVGKECWDAVRLATHNIQAETVDVWAA